MKMIKKYVEKGGKYEHKGTQGNSQYARGAGSSIRDLPSGHLRRGRSGSDLIRAAVPVRSHRPGRVVRQCIGHDPDQQ